MPEWYVTLRAARYAGVPWTVALGCPWNETIELACLIVENAEAQAEEIMAKRAAKR